jgi:hypothetical protein
VNSVRNSRYLLRPIRPLIVIDSTRCLRTASKVRRRSASGNRVALLGTSVGLHGSLAPSYNIENLGTLQTHIFVVPDLTQYCGAAVRAIRRLACSCVVVLGTGAADEWYAAVLGE